MRTVQQTDLHCELTGLNVLRGLSGKPEPGCLNMDAESELLSVTLKSLTISSMTGISESLCNTGTQVQHCDLACTNIKHMKVCMRNSLQLRTQTHTDEKHAESDFRHWMVVKYIPSFWFCRAWLQKFFWVFQFCSYQAKVWEKNLNEKTPIQEGQKKKLLLTCGSRQCQEKRENFRLGLVDPIKHIFNYSITYSRLNDHS